MKLAVLSLLIFCLSAFAALAQEQTTYTIQRGDTLFRIAQRYNVSMADLMAANNISNPSRIFAGTVLIIPGAAPAAPQPVVDAALPTDAPTQTVTHVVARGESLSMIARSYGVSMNAIIAANNIRNPNTIFAGQRLTIPGANPAVMEAVAAAAPAPAAQNAPDAPAGYIGSHVVRPGETLSLIARRYNVSWTALALANGIADPNRIEAGMTLRIPSNDGRIVAAQGDPGPRVGVGREIVVILSTQMTYAYENGVLMRAVLSSTGLPATPTVQGDYRVYAKYASAPMSGPGYYLPNVPYILYFYQGYALHGTYWHNNFGRPMSRGCVNLPTDEARWFFEFASIGTPVHVRWA